jgi:hypothetical protein
VDSVARMCAWLTECRSLLSLEALVDQADGLAITDLDLMTEATALMAARRPLSSGWPSTIARALTRTARPLTPGALLPDGLKGWGPAAGHDGIMFYSPLTCQLGPKRAGDCKGE